MSIDIEVHASPNREKPNNNGNAGRDGPVGAQNANHDRGNPYPVGQGNNQNNNPAPTQIPIPKVYFIHDGRPLSIAKEAFDTMDDEKIATLLNLFCAPHDVLHHRHHTPITAAEIAALRPKPIKRLEEMDLDHPKPPKDAIEPCYKIETLMFKSLSTLKMLYDTCVLIRANVYRFHFDGRLGNKLSPNPARIHHTFKKKDDEGLDDTPENRSLVEKVCNSKGCYMGEDKMGNRWFAKYLLNGSQVWAKTRNGEILKVGINTAEKLNNKNSFANLSIFANNKKLVAINHPVPKFRM